MTHPAEPILAPPVPPAATDQRQRWGVPRCGYRVNAFVVHIATRILWLGYACVWLAAIYFFLFVPRARRASMRYLDLLHNRRRFFLTRCWQTYRHMVEFGFLLLDRTLMLAQPKHGFTIFAEGLSNLAEATRTLDTGTLLLSAHFGNAEIAAPYLRHMGIAKPFHIVMYLDASHGSEKFFARNRHMLQDVHIISTTDPLSAGASIISALKKGDVVAMRADRTLSGRGIPVTFLGQPVDLPAGPFLAATLTGVPIVHVYTCRLGGRRYSCRISPVFRYGDDQPGTREERQAKAAQDFATHLESILREFPYQWVNFYDYWNHQRPR